MGLVSQKIVDAYVKSFNDWYTRGDYQNSGLVSFKLLNLLRIEKPEKMPDGIVDVAEKELKIACSYFYFEGVPLVGDKKPSYDDGKSSFRRLELYIHKCGIKLTPESEEKRVNLIHEVGKKGPKDFLQSYDRDEPLSTRLTGEWPVL